MAMGSKTNIQTSWNSSKNTHGCMFSRRKNKENNLEVTCWNHPNLIPHTVALSILILQRFNSTHLHRINGTISMFRDQRFDSLLKWFTSLIQTFNIYSINIQHQEAAAADIFPSPHSPAVLLGKDRKPCSAINMAGMSLVPQGQQHVDTKASKFSPRTHQRIVFTIVGDPFGPPPFWT